MMQVICEVAYNSIWLGTTVIELSEAETDAFMAWIGGQS